MASTEELLSLEALDRSRQEAAESKKSGEQKERLGFYGRIFLNYELVSRD